MAAGLFSGIGGNSGRAPGPPVAQCRAGGARAWPALGGGFGAATAAARGEQCQRCTWSM
ncbi:unnamed protein product [Cladocopium goreaui]|uniref:Uncharacterized protein n=1 Tax=Cladocopium goreaui TaxID=2562237 RepID=A0A9P1BYV7_9DINO|nr:unnamed protein product [Cladocopium goreaui]